MTPSPQRDTHSRHHKDRSYDRAPLRRAPDPPVPTKQAIRRPTTSQYENADEVQRLTQSHEAYVQPTSSARPASYFDVNSFLRRTLGTFTASPAARSTGVAEEQNFMTSPSKKLASFQNISLLLYDSDALLASPNRLPVIIDERNLYPPPDLSISHSPVPAQQVFLPQTVPPTQLPQQWTPAPGFHTTDSPMPSIIRLGESAADCTHDEFTGDFKPARFGSRTSMDSQHPMPLCRICHTSAEKNTDPLIAPCRCSGTMKYVHRSCLVRWLETSTKKICPKAKCELCSYNYKTLGIFHTKQLHTPHCTSRDRVFHIVFVLMFCVMVGCAALAILYLQKDPNGRINSSLNADDIMVIVCSVLFFCSFFIAVFTQYRAEASLGRLLCRCCTINRNWRIKNYERRHDFDYWKNVPAPPSALKKPLSTALSASTSHLAQA